MIMIMITLLHFFFDLVTEKPVIFRCEVRKIRISVTQDTFLARDKCVYYYFIYRC